MIVKPEWATARRLKPLTLFIVGLIHVFALVAPFSFTWTGLIVCVVLYYLTGGLGITMCYHRLLTHRSYKTPKWFEYLLTFFGISALQGGPISWVATHRLHHKESDQEPDPHTPQEGFLWSHLLWLMYEIPGFERYQEYRHMARDLERDPVHRFFEKSYFLLYVLSAVVLGGAGYLFGGWKLALSLVVWGCFLRTVSVWHSTWLVNSATHLWGYRRYKTTDNSRNNWWVALITFGEGWHNNHHADQRSAAHGHKWYEVDMTYWTIRFLQWIGLARDVVKPRFKRVATAANAAAAAVSPGSSRDSQEAA
ncbi:MAG: fatty acid desaturase [Candidatus Hydrogenedentales bacterium]